MAKYDAGSKWLIQHHGESLLRLAGVHDLVSWKAVQAETVVPRRIPDGLIEAHVRERAEPILFALEISAYPYTRLARQILEDAVLIYLARGAVPEVVALVLRRRGRKPAPSELFLRSQGGTTAIRVTWKVVEVWKIPAADLLAAGDLGLIPLVPLSAIDGPMEPYLDECRARIERDAPEDEREDLRVVTHFFAGLEYNDPRLFEKLGGNREMLKTGSPLLRELFEEVTREGLRKGRREGRREGRLEGRREGRLEGRHEGRLEGRREVAETDIITVLKARFGPEAEALSADLKAIDDARLESILAFAATCPDLASFREQIAPPKRKRRC